MLPYVRCLSGRYSPRVYVIANTDKISEDRLHAVEQLKEGEYTVVRIPRAREVKQSYVTSIFTTVRSTISSISLVFHTCPRLILCNGPGTCIPVCFAAVLARVLLFRQTLIVFVESVCRTRTLSLTGKILYYSRCADVIVQWPQLHAAYPDTVYLGLLS
ncbi:Asparagine-linked glycosylation 14 [Fasciola gigantica]|uniref:UDP-N-acetylglucosamine transferase subunit ALG14 n=1 Tax=Fasciola gigantica TaxID=46835 RepID=A0A504YGS6_FASGI|nr:Asparagine-linked glycosylation 14 [Fasciola gigantica]